MPQIYQPLKPAARCASIAIAIVCENWARRADLVDFFDVLYYAARQKRLTASTDGDQEICKVSKNTYQPPVLPGGEDAVE